MSLFRRNSDTTFDAAEILGESTAVILDGIATNNPYLMGKTLSNVAPKSVREETVGLIGSIYDNSVSTYGEGRTYKGSLQPALAAAHDKLVLDQLNAAEEDTATLMFCTLIDGTVAYPLTRVAEVPLLGKMNGKTVKARDLAHLVADMTFEPTKVMTYDHMVDHFPSTPYTYLRDRVAQQGAVLLGEALKWKNLGRTVNAIGAFITDGLDMGSTLSAAQSTKVMRALDESPMYTNLGLLVGELNDWMRSQLIRSIGFSGVLPNKGEMTENDLHVADPALAGKSTEELLSWYMEQQGLAYSVDTNLFLSRSTRPADIAYVAGQMSQVVYQASILAE